MPVTLTRRLGVVHAWRDPEFWGPQGRGCAHCHEHPAAVFGLPFGDLCFECLAAWFPGWDGERVIQWLGRQRAEFIRQGERLAAFTAWREHRDQGPALEYKRKYGNWLLDVPEP